VNINLTELGSSVSLYLWVLGITLGPIVVNMVARKKVKHILRSTIFGFFLSVAMPLVFIQLILLLKKDDIAKAQKQ